jgi:hypothetical protein
MDEYINEYYDDNNHQKKKFKVNPEPYQIEMLFRGTSYNVTIKNTNYDKFKVEATKDADDDQMNEQEIKCLDKYLKAEGFYIAAQKHNLFF